MSAKQGRTTVFELKIEKQLEDLGEHYFARTPQSGEIVGRNIQDVFTIIGVLNQWSYYYVNHLLQQLGGDLKDTTLEQIFKKRASN